MTSIRSEWEPLNLIEYELSCTNPNVVVKDSRSSSLSIAIALINIHHHRLKRPMSNLIGTGLVRIDGSIEGSSYEDIKIQALKENVKFATPILTSKQCSHLFELDTYMK